MLIIGPHSSGISPPSVLQRRLPWPSAFEPLGLFWFELDGDFTEHVICYNHVPWYEDRWKENPPPSYAIGTGMNINVVDVTGDDRVDIVVAGKSGLYLLVNQGVPEVK